MALAATDWRQAILLFQSSERDRAWQLRESQMGAYLALEALPVQGIQGHTYGTSEPVLMDFHVCYSPSYQVPVMYFRAMTPDGAPLSYGALQDLFPRWPRGAGQLAAFIAKQDHPLLPGPPVWFSLHPCNTATVLALALGLEQERAQLATADVPGLPATPPSPGLPATPPSPAADRRRCEALAPESDRVRGRSSETGAALQPAGDRDLVRDGGADEGLCADQEDAEGSDVPDLDELLVGLGAGVGPGSGRCAEADLGAGVGPSGVRWPEGQVPACPSDPSWLRRYMVAWFSLVGPHVGLVEGRVRSL